MAMVLRGNFGDVHVGGFLLRPAVEPFCRSGFHDRILPSKSCTVTASDEFSNTAVIPPKQVELPQIGDVDKSKGHPVNDIIDGSIGHDAHLIPPVVLIPDLQLFAFQPFKDRLGVFMDVHRFHQGGDVADRTPDVRLAKVDDPGYRRGETAHAQVEVKKQRGDFRAFQQVVDIVVGFGQLVDLLLVFGVDGHQFLIGGLKLFARGLQLFIGALQFLVDRLQLFIGGFVLLIRGFQLFGWSTAGIPWWCSVHLPAV